MSQGPKTVKIKVRNFLGFFSLRPYPLLDKCICLDPPYIYGFVNRQLECKAICVKTKQIRAKSAFQCRKAPKVQVRDPKVYIHNSLGYRRERMSKEMDLGDLGKTSRSGSMNILAILPQSELKEGAEKPRILD